ncbi:MAG: isoprenylcysteine carboxylmethyltransferase family protein [bacterium]|nr:isoprenylcysteine carboxylmethyltransferase family protein [bacterium]
MKINVYFILFLTVFLTRNIIEPRIKPKTGKVEQGKATLSFFILSYLVSAITVLILLQKSPPVDPAGFIAGITLMVSAYAFRIITIKQFWHSYNQGIIPSGQLITTGIYSVVRHPLYFFYNVEMLALIIIKFNIISILTLFLTIEAALIRMKQEEVNLADKFGVDYESYRSKTKRFIPYLY